MDAKDLLFYSWLSMWKCYITTLWLNAKQRNKRRDDEGDGPPWLRLVLHESTRALPFLQTSANTSQLVNSEPSDKFDFGRREYDRMGCLYCLFSWTRQTRPRLILCADCEYTATFSFKISMWIKTQHCTRLQDEAQMQTEQTHTICNMTDWSD